MNEIHINAQVIGYKNIGNFETITDSNGPQPLPTLKPSLSIKTHLGLTWLFIVLYGLLFSAVYIQLWMILWYKHKRLSYQTVFLFLCIFWAGLRVTLFSFYFNNCILANNLDLFPYWLLYCCPVCLQFITLCLLVLFFAQVVFKAKAKYEPHRYKRPLRGIIAVVILTFLAVNITSAVLSHKLRSTPDMSIFIIIRVRVIINDTLFVICGVCLAVCIYNMSKMSATNLVLEAKGTTVCQALVTNTFIILLYSSRALYNLVVVFLGADCGLPNFGFNWINVSDQADFVDLDEGYNYLSFGIVLFIWEILPTFIVIVFFRVKRPKQSMEVLNDMSSRNYNPRAYFFDNPRRYDSDEDLTRSGNSRSSLLVNSTDYVVHSGSMPRSYGSSAGHYGATPPLIFTAHSNNSAPYNQRNQPNYYDGT